MARATAPARTTRTTSAASSISSSPPTPAAPPTPVFVKLPGQDAFVQALRNHVSSTGYSAVSMQIRKMADDARVVVHNVFRLERTIDEDIREFERVANAVRDLDKRILSAAEAWRRSSSDEIALNVQQLIDEFGPDNVSFASNSVSVTPEDEVVLETTDDGTEVNLGRWKIVVFVEGRLEVHALTPRCPAGVTDHPHPHVNSKTHLCLGQGSEPYSNSVKYGRLWEAVSVVWSVLNTYTGEGVYIPLEDWLAKYTCPECNSEVEPEDTYTCTGCSTTVCHECWPGEEDAEDGSTLCGKCGASCDECERWFKKARLANGLCPGCRARCTACRTSFPKKSASEDGRCPKCVAEGREVGESTTKKRECGCGRVFVGQGSICPQCFLEQNA